MAAAGAPRGCQLDARFRQHKTRRLGELQILGRLEAVRRVAVPADLSPVLNIAAGNQPAQVIGRKSDGRQRVDLDGEIPQVALHVAGVIRN